MASNGCIFAHHTDGILDQNLSPKADSLEEINVPPDVKERVGTFMCRAESGTHLIVSGRKNDAMNLVNTVGYMQSVCTVNLSDIVRCGMFGNTLKDRKYFHKYMRRILYWGYDRNCLVIDLDEATRNISIGTIRNVLTSEWAMERNNCFVLLCDDIEHFSILTHGKMASLNPTYIEL